MVGAVDWIEAIGYQHEPLHAGALAIVLADAESRLAVAETLFDHPVRRVDDPLRERRIGPNRRRPVDVLLKAESSTGAAVRLGVEVKVDSAWSPRQLTEEVGPDDTGLLLALGCTALAVQDDDLPRGWRLMGPKGWAELLRRHGSQITELDRYRGHVEREAAGHADALRLVAAGDRVRGERTGITLEHWAYFHEVRRNAGGLDVDWERKTLISGPLLTLWLRNPPGAYIELMAIGERRELCVKCWPDGRSLLSIRAELVERLHDLPGMEGAREVRPAKPTAKSCTALAKPLEGVLPSEAAKMCGQIAAALAVP